MTNLSPYDLLRTSSLVTLVLLLKYTVTSARWAGARQRAGQRAPEDPGQNALPGKAELEAAERARMVVFNDLENLPLGLVVVWASALCILFTQVGGSAHGSPADQESLGLIQAHVALTCTFAAMRIAHSVVYSAALPSLLRTVVYTVGLASVYGLALLAVITSFRTQYNDIYN